ncbi:hypothetical protein [Streptomyces sp. NPDC021020]|uniref:hypothetical protein n=1 Tax=Streptomyces sp. NPDC021020 TaxID=3365109 RepID=UPI00378DC478
MKVLDLTRYTPSRARVDGQLMDVLIPPRRWYDALLASQGDELLDRWNPRVHQDLGSPTASHDCWVWTGGVSSGGYGVFRLGGQQTYAHKIAWAIEHGSPPAFAFGPHGWEGVHLGHMCHDADSSCPGGTSDPHRRCCNPGHLGLQLHSTNVRAGRSGEHQRRKITCPSGHDYATNGYLYTDPARVTRRYCRACKSGGRAVEFVGIRKATQELAVAA